MCYSFMNDNFYINGHEIKITIEIKSAIYIFENKVENFKMSKCKKDTLKEELSCHELNLYYIFIKHFMFSVHEP